jgi:hypothetical protein
MPNYYHIFVRETLQQFLEGLDGLAAKGLNRIVIVIMVLLGKTVSLEVEGKHGTEVLDFFGDSSEAESGMSCSMDAEKNGSFGAGPED